MRKLLILLTLGLLQCSQTTSPLTISVVPTSPVLVPLGDGTTVGGNDLTTPYFVVSKVNISWAGPKSVSLLTLTLSTRDKKYTCSFSGDDLLAILPTTLSDATSILDATSGTIVLPERAGGVTISASVFGCGSVAVKDRTASSFFIPMDVRLD
ncbi:MAG: hypothetical protein IT289_06085, partial [Oligoflexia bacterium]|nr:hypothetical protein [Oligoflexia bacterium]